MWSRAQPEAADSPAGLCLQDLRAGQLDGEAVSLETFVQFCEGGHGVYLISLLIARGLGVYCSTGGRGRQGV